MHFTTALAGIFACLSAAASAQYTNRSYPFNLVLESSNKTVNGIHLTACHSGAAIESLCTYPTDPKSESQQFYYNYTTNTADKSTQGVITWNLNVTSFIESEPMSFAYNPASNVAIPLFTPGGADFLTVTFDKNNYLYVLSYTDDTTSPPKYAQQKLSRWQLCTTYYGSYTYQTLAWVLGSGKPQNPTCQSVKVKRQAVPK